MTIPKSQPFQLGGQALIEGVMMRSPHFVAASVRRTDGSIATTVEPVHAIVRRYRWLGLPLLRGVVGLFEMMGLGMRFLNWSSAFALEPAAAGDRRAVDGTGDGVSLGTSAAASTEAAVAGHAVAVLPEVETAPPPGLPPWAFAGTVGLALGVGLLLFVALPYFVTAWTVQAVTNNRIAFNLGEGAVKLAIFIAYIYLIGRRSSIRRVFEYHGAEHKVVYAAENGRPLTPEGARPFDTPHPRCGTGFALLTVVVSIACFAFIPTTGSRFARVLWRLALMPLVAGISYELIKATTHPRWGRLAQWLMTPGMWLQRLTTRQPDDSQLEVSCAAMRAVIAAEEGQTAQVTTGVP